jgi:DNA uptake protein ComE-like DNA-binding protein
MKNAAASSFSPCLSLAAYSYNDLILSEYRAADTYVRMTQARAAADSGVARTMAMLCDSNAYSNSPLNSNPWNNSDAFQDVIVNDDPDPRKRTKYSIISLCSDPNDPLYSITNGSPPYRFGVQDESAKLNINILMTNPNNDTGRINMLSGSPYGLQSFYYPMTSDLPNYLLDWMDPNPTSTRNPTAKDSYYMGLQPPYHCKNGPFDTLEELLLVSNITPQMVFGNDHYHNGTAVDDSNPPNQGWSSYMTVYSHEPNVDINNNARIYLNDPNLQTLNTNLTNLTNQGASQLAQFVIAYRLYGGSSITPGGAAGNNNNNNNNNNSGSTQAPATPAPMPPAPPTMSSTDMASIQTQIATDLANAGTSNTKNQITSLTSLVSSKVTVNVGTGRNMKSITFYSPLAYPSNQAQLLPILYDEYTTTNAADLTPRININTASAFVLYMLPGLAQSEVQSIINNQPINPNQIGNLQEANASGATNPYNTIGWLIFTAGIAPSRVAQIEPYITARSRIYRFQSIGYFESGTPVCRLEVVVDTSGWAMTNQGISVGRPRIVYRRDISELGSGNFDFLPKMSK